METPLPDISNLDVLSDDSAICDAMADLDAKLLAFVSAMRDAQNQLRAAGGVEPLPAPQEDAPPADVDAATEEAVDAPPAETDAEPPAEAAAAEAPPETESGQTDADAADSPVVEAIEPTKGWSLRPKEPLEVPPAPPKFTADSMAAEDQEAAAAAAAAAAEPANPDEELLASLDPEVAKMVRVLRRLNPNRPVEELIRQVEGRKNNPAARSTNKGWFNWRR